MATAIADAQAFEAQRRRAEALAEIDRAKTTFFSNVSHEFRTPLTLMLGPVEDSLGRPASAAAAARAAAAGATQLAAAAASWSTRCSTSHASKPAACRPRYEPTDLAAFTRDLASTFRSAIERAGLRFDGRVRGAGELVYVDREMWEKIVLNLLSNAFKFTLEGRDRGATAPPAMRMRCSRLPIPAWGIPAQRARAAVRALLSGRGHRRRAPTRAPASAWRWCRSWSSCMARRIDVDQRARDAAPRFCVRLPFGSAHLSADRIKAPRSHGLDGHRRAGVRAGSVALAAGCWPTAARHRLCRR